VSAVSSVEFNLVYGPPLVVLRYTLYPDALDELAAHERVTECWIVPPVPERATVVGVVEALVVICRLPVTAPLVCGENLTVTGTDWPDASVNGKVSAEAAKPVPLTATLLMLTLTVDGLLMVTVWLAVDPITTVPNARDVGVTVIEPVGVGVGLGVGVGVGVGLGEGVGDGVGVGVGLGVGLAEAPVYS
jgi:hypothetical protein